MPYEPFNLSSLQIGLESGGKQLDKFGHPLTSSAGAIGVAQVMPNTARETATKHKIPWDENKYKTDRDYNMRLGDLYQGDMNEQFGKGSLAATAAYNAGPGEVSRLMKEHGDKWAQHLTPETKHYLKVVKGVDVGGSSGGYYPEDDAILNATASALGVKTKNYKVGQPQSGEKTTGVVAPQVNSADVQRRAKLATSASDQYTQFLHDAVDPLIQNQAAVLERTKAIVGIKRNIVNDFANREADLESKIRPLLAQREQIAGQLTALDSLSPLDRRFKAIFNPQQYDPRMLRGHLERIESAISVYDSNYTELNKLRAGVAAASVDAESADVAMLGQAAQNTLAQSQLYGQVRAATIQNVGDHLFGLSSHVETMKLEEAATAHLLGQLTTEKITSLYQTAQASPNGFVMMDGIRLNVGQLQDAARQAQGQDINFRNMVNAYKVSDLHTADAMESNYVDHMTPEQIQQAMVNGGKIKGADGTDYQLSLGKLTQALDSATRLRDTQVEGVVNKTAAGIADGTLRQLSTNMNATRTRAIEMFGNAPGEYQGMQGQVQASYQAWRKGFDALHGNDAAQSKYVAETMPQLQAMNQLYDSTVTKIANKWGGGKAELSAVADSYLRGNPISGDAALKGLVIIARSGMPAGSKVSGPAAQALAVARATVQEWDNPQPGDSADMLAKAMAGDKHKESDLLRLVQKRVGSVYADGMADAIITDLPALARGVRDPQNPGRNHPFARVSREDFVMSVRHGDASAYEILGNKMGVDGNTAKRIFSSGTDSAEWKALAQKKGYGNGQFEQFYQALQATQMSETLSALDASHSSAPGFSAAKAYVDFLATPEVQNRVNQAVQGYGQSSFGSFLLSSSAGGGFKDAWDGYVESVSAVYQQQHSKELRQRVTQSRSMGGDPWVRMNAVNRAAGLNPQESQILLQNIKPLVAIQGADTREMAMPGVGVPMGSSKNFDAISTIIRTHKFDDPQVEALRRKVATQWDTMDSLVGTVFDSVNE